MANTELDIDFESRGLSTAEAIDHAKHMIGLDDLKHKPYKRHGKKYFRPWRNYWCGFDPVLDFMSEEGNGLTIKRIGPKALGGDTYYHLTRKGLDWLGMQIDVTIYDERE